MASVLVCTVCEYDTGIGVMSFVVNPRRACARVTVVVLSYSV